jgi:hypothetical protein
MTLIRRNFVPVDVRPIPSPRTVQWNKEDNSGVLFESVVTTLEFGGIEGFLFDMYSYATTGPIPIEVWAYDGIALSLTNWSDGTSDEVVSFFTSHNSPSEGDQTYNGFRMYNANSVMEEFARFGAEATFVNVGKGLTRKGAAVISALDDGVMTQFLWISPRHDRTELDLPLDVTDRGGAGGHISSTGQVTSTQEPLAGFTPFPGFISEEGGLAMKSNGPVKSTVRIIDQNGNLSFANPILQIKGPGNAEIDLFSSADPPELLWWAIDLVYNYAAEVSGSPNTGEQYIASRYPRHINFTLGGGPYSAGETITITINGLSHVFTAAGGESVQDAVDDLAAQINAGAQAVNVTASKNATQVIVISDTHAHLFAYNSGSTGGATISQAVVKDPDEFAGHPGELAVWNGASWDFTSPTLYSIAWFISFTGRQQWDGTTWENGYSGDVFVDNIISKTVATPPGSPSPGDMYIVPVGGSGAWGSPDGSIVVYDPSTPAWEEITPQDGDIANVIDQGIRYIYAGTSPSGAWGVETSASGDELNIIGFSNCNIGSTGGRKGQIQLGSNAQNTVAIEDSMGVNKGIVDASAILEGGPQAEISGSTRPPRGFKFPPMSKYARNSISVLGFQNDPSTPPDYTTGTNDEGVNGTTTVVISRTITTPPAGSGSDTYIVAPGSTGAWAGKDNQIAIWDGVSAWDFYVQKEGDQLGVGSPTPTETVRFLNGAWRVSDPEGTVVYVKVEFDPNGTPVTQWHGYNGTTWVQLG